MKEIVLKDEAAIKEKQLWRKPDNRTKITQHLVEIVDTMIEDAKKEWLELQDPEDVEHITEDTIPLPLVRLRVEYTAPDNGEFNCENPQRFSNRFQGKVANTNDVVQFYRKKQTVNRKCIM
jgi:double-strand break repair protein MRE11